VSSIEEDLGLSDVQYQTCVSILFVGYVITGIPSNMLITRVKVPTFLVTVMMTWAAISIATGLTKNYMGLLLTRVCFFSIFTRGKLLLTENSSSSVCPSLPTTHRGRR
jgi:predicted MFS family arabinose efflux permease